MLVLDGSYGEGGGQILRTALSLAALTNTSVRLVNIRTGRAKPGLRPQHLTAVQSLARITRAELTGDTIGSTQLTFSPRGIYPGRYMFDVAEKTGSAGAVSLVAQTLLPVLLFAQTSSTVVYQRGHTCAHEPPGPLPHGRVSPGPARDGRYMRILPLIHGGFIRRAAARSFCRCSRSGS